MASLSGANRNDYEGISTSENRGDLPSLENDADGGMSVAQIEMQPLANGKTMIPFDLEEEEGKSHEELGWLWSRLPRSWCDWMYPPNIPHSVQLFRRENLAVPICYLVVGLLQGLSGPFINVYPMELGATEAQQATISSLRSLPASFKLVFGFWSDNRPLWGYRRKSYMFLGWLLTSLSMMALVTSSDLGFDEISGGLNDDGEELPTIRSPHEGAPSIPFLSICLLLFGTGFWFADVMGDSIVVSEATSQTLILYPHYSVVALE
jgi:hypothetical protein